MSNLKGSAKFNFFTSVNYFYTYSNEGFRSLSFSSSIQFEPASAVKIIRPWGS